MDYANNTLFVVNGPERPSDKREVAGYGFNLNTGDLCLKFGNFLDPHDLAVTSDAREVFFLNLLIMKKVKGTFLIDLCWRLVI